MAAELPTTSSRCSEHQDVRDRRRPASTRQGQHGVLRPGQDADKGIEKILAEQGISYHPILELGNLFLELDDWRPPYRELLRQSGELLVARLDGLPEPFCLSAQRSGRPTVIAR